MTRTLPNGNPMNPNARFSLPQNHRFVSMHIIIATYAMAGSAAIFNFGSNLIDPIIAPSVQPNRLSCLSESQSIVVNGRTVSIVNTNTKELQLSSVQEQPDAGNVVKHQFAEPSVCVSMAVSEIAASSCLQGCCRVGDGLAYAVDSRLNVVVAREQVKDTKWDYSFLPADSCPFTNGFSAVTALSESDIAVTNHYLSKMMKWVDVRNGQSIRSSITLYNPTAITSMDTSNSSCVAISEGRCLSIWDHRIKENGNII